MNELYLKDEIEGKEQVCKWDFVSTKDDDARVYYKLTGGDKGFHFHALGFGGHHWIEGYRKWDAEGTMIERIYHGWAAFDGIRHLFMGYNSDEFKGYLNYPDVSRHAEIFQILERLEKEHCSDCWD